MRNDRALISDCAVITNSRRSMLPLSSAIRDPPDIRVNNRSARGIPTRVRGHRVAPAPASAPAGHACAVRDCPARRRGGIAAGHDRAGPCRTVTGSPGTSSWAAGTKRALSTRQRVNGACSQSMPKRALSSRAASSRLSVASTAIAGSAPARAASLRSQVSSRRLSARGGPEDHRHGRRRRRSRRRSRRRAANGRCPSASRRIRAATRRARRRRCAGRFCSTGSASLARGCHCSGRRRFLAPDHGEAHRLRAVALPLRLLRDPGVIDHALVHLD